MPRDTTHHAIHNPLSADLTPGSTCAIRARTLFYWRIGVLCICFGTGLQASLRAQNLVPNPDFEFFTTCPMFMGIGGPMLCAPWNSVESPDYFNACGNLVIGVPFNDLGFQEARSGDAYTGVYAKLTLGAIDVREYIQVQLDEPLVAGNCYSVGCYINLGDGNCGIDRFGLLLTEDPIANPLGATPQVNPTGTFFLDQVDWMLISGEFIAQGGEEYLTIGNFADDANTQFHPPCNAQGAIAYYFIEDVFVQEIPVTPIDLELDGPLEGCTSVTIDPGFPDYTYQWSNGSQGSTLTVTESGIYSVTATLGCATAEDEVEVVILAPPAVDLGPDMILCEGESILVELDPDMGNYTWQDGSTGPSFTITTGGVYQVTVENACGTATDALLIEAIPDLPADPLGDDLQLCAGGSVAFAFDPGLGDFLWQDNSTSSSYVVMTSGTYSVTISNACGTVEDEIEVTFLDPPALVLPDSIFFCQGEFYLVELDPDITSYEWDDGSTESAYFISQPGTYAVTATNDCGEVVDVIEAAWAESPALNLGPDVMLCPGDSVTIGQPGLPGTWTWQNGDTTSAITVNAAGVYVLTQFHACGSISDSISIGIEDTLVAPDLGPDLVVCPGQQAVLFAVTAGATTTWSDGSMADSLVILGAGTYWVTFSNACAALTDSITVIADAEPPSFSFPDTLTLCAGDTIRLDPQLNGVSFTWSTGAITSFIEVTTPGLYGLTVSNPCGTENDTVFVQDGGPAPAVSLGADTTLCLGDTFTLMPLFQDVVAWRWFDNSTDPAFSISAPGVYSITATNACGDAVDTVMIGSLTTPDPVSLGPDTALCPGETLTITLSSTNGAIEWPDGSGGFSYTTGDSGWIYVNISNVCGSVTDSLRITGLPPVPIVDLGPNLSICPGETLRIEPGIPGVDYRWQDGSTADFFETSVPGTIILAISNSCGSSTDTLVILESSDPPVLNLGPDVTACVGEAITLEAGISGVDYAWSTGDTTERIDVLEDGVFTLRVQNACGTATDSIAVTFAGLPPAQDLGPDIVACAGDQVILSAITPMNEAVLWSTGSTSPQIIATSAGQYTVSVTNDCGTTADTIDIDVDAEPPAFDLGPDTLLCPGESVTLLAPTTAYAIRWQDGRTEIRYDVVASGTYVLTLSNACGVASDSVSVIIRDPLPDIDLPELILLCPDSTILLDASLPVPAEYQWSTGAVTPTLLVNAPGMYAVVAADDCGTVRDSIEILQDDDCAEDIRINIPNIFSPNGDGINDVFTYSAPPQAAVRSVEGQIFDRWGNMVYQSTADPFTWDGRFQGDLLNPAVFVYVIRLVIVRSGLDERIQLSGDVTLIR